ncbi:MAG: T9SS type A sorting domain-containing protein [Ginsengibacter sp.]
MSGGDAHSINNAISFITSTYDLEPDSVSNCAFDNAGTPVTTPIVINTDINSKPRSTVSPDLGAFEFGYVGFTIIAGSNSPVCAGDSVTLTVDPGKGISPHFSWSNTANVIISTLQNPTLFLTASGQYKVVVTDSTGCSETDSTLVTVDQRPTATLTSVTSLCDSGVVYLNITVTGTGTINGTLSNGDDFSGTAPLIIDTILVTSTTSFNIISLSDSTCSSIPSDIPDTVTVSVTHTGDWLGITTNWHDPVNWCGGILPTSSTDVNIPTGTPKMPLITDSVYCNSLAINTGDTLTVTGTGTLNLAGILTNSGIYTDNGTTNFNGTSGQQTFSGVTTFNNLMLNNTSGLLLPIAITVKKDLTISAGILNANNFNISVAGNWTNNASATALTGAVTFNGTTSQVIGGTFATTFTNVTISTTGSTVSLNVNASILGNLSISTGTFNLAGFTANRASAGGILTISGGATLKIGGTNTYPGNYTTNTLAVSSTVEYSGTNQTVSNQIYGNLKLSSSAGAAIKTFPATALTIVGNLTGKLGSGTSVSFTASSNIAVSGNVSIGVSAFFDGGSYSHSIGGNWTNNGTFTGNTSTIIFTGIGAVVSGVGAQNFNNLTVAASGVSFSNNSITLTGNLATTGPGSFTQASGGILLMSGTGKTITGSGISLNDLTVSGIVTTSVSLNLAGNLSVSGSFSASIGTITMIGASKIITGTGTIGFGILSVTGSLSSDADFSISSGVIVSGSLSASAGTATFKGTSSLSGTANLYNIAINGTQLQLAGNSVLGIANTFTVISGTLNVTSTPNTVNFNGTGAQNINGITYNNLTLSNGSTKTATAGIVVNNDITINTGTTFNSSSYTHSIYRDWINNGTFAGGTGTIQFSGNASSNISGVTIFKNLTIKKASGLTTLSSNATVNGVLNFITGIIQTGNNLLIQPSSGTITAAAQNTGWVNGNLQKNIAVGSNVSNSFEIGDANYYTPVTILFANVSISGSLTANTTPADHPQIDFSGINKDLDINRYWILTNTGIGFTTAASTFNWVAPDLDAGATTANFKSSVYDGTLWGFSNFTSPLPTSIQATGLTSLGSFVVGEGPKITTWTGAAGTTDWFTARNWFGGVPDGIVETLIPTILQAGRSFPAINTGTAKVDTVTIESAAALVITNSTLQIKGAIVNSGTIDAGNGTIEMTGSSAQSLAANIFQNNAVNNLIISNSSAAGVTLGGALDLYGSLTYSGTGMKLTTNDTLTLKSTALNTARIGDMTGNTITGKVTVERYISARKAWRLLSIPTNTTQTIQEAWQEGCGANLDCITGFGTQITGAAGVPAGFDVYTGTPSMKTYMSATNAWAGVPNTNVAGIKSMNGYIIFIRGDRSATAINSIPTQTILRTKGNLYTGDQAPILVSANTFASIGNPYASALDMRYITKTTMKDFFYVWDPNLGGSSGFGAYQTFSYNGSDYVVTPGMGSYGASGTVNNYLQSGQAFLIQARRFSDGSLIFKEGAKTSGSGQVSLVAGLPQPQLRTSLYGVKADNSAYMIDGTLINYEDGYSNSVDDMDAIKSINTSENLSIKTANTLLVIERRQGIVQQDTIFLNLANTKVQKYRFGFIADQLGRPGLSGFLEDTYLHSSTPLNLNGSTVADFNIVNIPGSYAPGRFRIVFKQLSTLPVTFTSIKAYQVNKNIAVEWKAENESNLRQYSVEKSVDGNHYATANTVAANNAALSNYNWLDVNPSQGYNYYRIFSTDVTGKTAYSTVVKVNMGSVKQMISIYPNPVTDGIINLQFTNEPAGNYGIRLLNKLGQVMISKQINHVEGNSTEMIQLDKYSAHGIYQLEVTRPDGKTVNIEVIY